MMLSSSTSLLLPALWVPLPAALDQATVSRGWLLPPLATPARPVASRPPSAVPPGRLERRPRKLPEADSLCFRALCRTQSPAGQPLPRLFLFFPKARSVASLLQRKRFDSYGANILRKRRLHSHWQLDAVPSACQAMR